jgi:hypothetical protein
MKLVEKYFRQPETEMAAHIQDRQRQIISLAELLHLWHCSHEHSVDGSTNTDCTWNCEKWGPTDDLGFGSSLPLSKQKYYDKAERMWNFLKTVDEAKKTLYFLQMVNPKLAWKLIDEL